jgi:uncharacterized protein (DUF433 family)
VAADFIRPAKHQHRKAWRMQSAATNRILYPPPHPVYKFGMNERITFNPNQCGGRPCIRGMRIRVKDILDLLAARVPEEEILEDYPYLESEDIAACLEFAAAEADHPVLVTR